MIQTLYLLRHAKAELWSPDVDDFGRCLADRGHKHMEQLAAHLQGQLSAPDVVLCSSARRTRETLMPLQALWPDIESVTKYTDSIYEASSGTLHHLAEQAFEQADTVMMVGHNPGLEYLTLALLRDEDAQDIHKMPTGTLAVIDFENGYPAAQGKLRFWLTRKNLAD